MAVGIFRGGCLTGPSHSGVELHGYHSYLIKTFLRGKQYTVFGYEGKRVRDNIQSFDVVRMFKEFARNPRPGELYYLGGGRANGISMLEAISRIQALTGRKINWTYSEQARNGDHIFYISNLAKPRSPFPDLDATCKFNAILEEMVLTEPEHTHHVRTV
jgi:CDP-paratose 2-epimerase